jgi:nitrate reductase beta subunit
MFGPGVDAAIDRYVAPDRELLAVLQLFRCTNRILFGYRMEEGPKVHEATVAGRPFTMYDDTVVGLGERGEELVRIKVNEPLHKRPATHLNSI